MIQGLGQGLAVSFTTGVVQGANFAEMRDLTVTCVPTAKRAWCLTVANHQASPSYFQMDVTTIQDAGDGPRWGFRNTEASPKFDQVRISVAHGTSNYGIVNASGSAPTIRRSFIKVVHGAADNNGILDVNDGSASLVADTVNIGSSWLRGGGAIVGFTTERCAAVYTNLFTFFPNTCP